MTLKPYLAAHKRTESEDLKTRIPIPQDYNNNDSISAYTSIRKQSTITSNASYMGKKEQHHEQIIDRVLEYLVFEVTHGENFFRDLTCKFDELLQVRYQPYLPLFAEGLLERKLSGIRTTKTSIDSTMNSRRSNAGIIDIQAGSKQSYKVQSLVSKSQLSDKSTIASDSFIKCLLPKYTSKGIIEMLIKEIKEFVSLLEILLYQVVYSFIMERGVAIEQILDRKLREAAHAIIFHPSLTIFKTLKELIQRNQQHKERSMINCSKKWRNLLPIDFSVDEDFCLKGVDIPYLGAIEALNMLQVLHTPEEKMRTICFMKDEIVWAVDRYWKEKNPNKKASELTISADQLVPIYTYIVAKSGNLKVGSELMFVNSLLDDSSTKFGEQAYFLATLSISADYLLNEAAEENKHQKESVSAIHPSTLGSLHSYSQSIRKDYNLLLIEEEDEKGKNSITISDDSENRP